MKARASNKVHEHVPNFQTRKRCDRSSAASRHPWLRERKSSALVLRVDVLVVVVVVVEEGLLLL